MSTSTRLVVVGGGHMGLAIVQGLLGTAPDRRLALIESDPARRVVLVTQAGLGAYRNCRVTGRLHLTPDDLVVLAIPPQVFGDFADVERHQFGPRTPVLSIMAGLTTAVVGHALGTDQVVRAIPNTPSEVFAGMSVYFAPPTVREETIAEADDLLTSIGKTLRVHSESLVDDATAICGGGPAFVSYIVDAFCQFATARGFTEAAGREMAVQVFGGTAALIGRTDKAPMQLCREVMTPNGTTERGIAAFEAAHLKNSVVSALTASATRSREIASIMNAPTPG